MVKVLRELTPEWKPGVLVISGDLTWQVTPAGYTELFASCPIAVKLHFGPGHADQQWEAAARGKEGRIYAWGPEDRDEHRANYGDKVGGPTPVGMFPDGDTPDGVADMAGNVREWTCPDFNRDSQSVRGAGFVNGARHLRANLRFAAAPILRGAGFEFRCVRE